MKKLIIASGRSEFEIKSDLIKWSGIIYFPSCMKLNVLDHIPKNITIEKIQFWFDKVENLGISLLITDRLTSLDRRPLKSQLKMYTGPRIENENLMSPRIDRYVFSLSQTIHSPETIKCVNYPTADYKNYKECDEAFVYNQMKNYFKLMPFWATSNFSEVTKLRLVKATRLTVSRVKP